MHYVGQTNDQFRSRWNYYKSDSRKHGQGATCMQQLFFKHFCTPGRCGFLEDVSLTTGEAHLIKTMTPFGLNIEEIV